MTTMTEEQKEALKTWKDRWIANACSTAPMTDEDREACRKAIAEVYTIAKFDPPKRVLFAKSALEGAYLAGYWAARYDVENYPDEAVAQLGRLPTDAEWEAARERVQAIMKRRLTALTEQER